jgi:hypothetical protein
VDAIGDRSDPRDGDGDSVIASGTADSPAVEAAEAQVIDEQMPRCDVAIAEHLIVEAPAGVCYQAVRTLDLLTVHSPIIDAAFLLRGLPSRLKGTAPPAPPSLVIGEGMALPGWLMLGERPGREIAVGAVGRFWQPDIVWRDVPPEQFAAFDEPGWGKIAASFLVRPYGTTRSLITYEVRTLTTDSVSRAKFSRYWWLIRPFVAHLMRAALRTVADNARDNSRRA